MAVDSSLFDFFNHCFGYVFDGCFRSEARIGFGRVCPCSLYRLPGMGVQPIDLAALTRGPVVAYGHQAFLVQIALSGIRHDFSDICACEFHAAEPFTIRALGHMWWTMGIMRTT